MLNLHIKRGLIIVLLCPLAVAANFALYRLAVNVLGIPLFLDTVFTAAVSFALGLWPGLLTAILHYSVVVIHQGNFNPFILCSIAEVLLICWLSPLKGKQRLAETPDRIRHERNFASKINLFAGLLFLYIVCSLSISVLGGLIDFFYYGVWSNPRPGYSAEDTFKIRLFQSNIHLLVINILSRIPVNIVDRFIVIFGGFFISRAILRIAPTKNAQTS